MDATFKQNGSHYTLGFERSLAHAPDKVWRVLTERDLLKQWFPADVEGEWTVGSPLRFHFLHGEGEGLSEEELSGEVLTVEPPRLLEFRWGKETIRCEIVPEGKGCKLCFSHDVEDPSWGARNAVGWEACLENLDSLLQGASVAKFAVEMWQSKFAKYAKRFEPDFGPQLALPENYPTESAASDDAGPA